MTEQVAVPTLAEAMKSLEDEYRQVLGRAPWAVIRVDGKAFHTWTRGLEKPFDGSMNTAMDAALAKLCGAVQGAALGYTQSDELSVLFRPSVTSEWWLGGNVQKIASVSASIVTHAFAQAFPDRPPAWFDSRVSTLPSEEDAVRYLQWRIADAQKNAVSGLAQSKFSHRELHRKHTGAMLEMLGADGERLTREQPRCYTGGFVVRRQITEPVTFTHSRTGEEITTMVDRRPWFVEHILSPDVRALLKSGK